LNDRTVGERFILTDLEEIGSGLAEVLFRNLLEGTKKNHKNSQSSGVLAEIQSEHKSRALLEHPHIIPSPQETLNIDFATVFLPILHKIIKIRKS
jgi:hypothetical protein